MYKLSKKRLEEMMVVINSPIIKGKDLVEVSDLFHLDEEMMVKWGDYDGVAKEIHKTNPIMYSKQKDVFYKYDKVWKSIEKSKRNDVQDLIRREAKKDGMRMDQISIPSIESEVRYNAKEFGLNEEGNMNTTRYKVYVFKNGTGYWNVKTGAWSFHEGKFDPSDEARAEDNGVFPFDYTTNKTGITDLYQLFVEWGISPKQLMYILAYAMFFKVDFLNKMFYFVGGGSNGKSMAIQMIEALFPVSGRTNLSISSLTGDKDGSEALESSYVNLSSEIKLSDFDSTFMKRITGGDTVSINPKNLKPFSIVPTAKHFVSSNSVPQLRETSHGDLRRFLLIEFTRTFPFVENFYDDRIAPYIPQLFTALVGVAQRIVSSGMYIDKNLLLSSKIAINETSDLVYQFIEEFEIKKDVNDKRDSRTVYDKFVQWCNFNRTGVYKKRRFIEGMYKHLGDIKKPGSSYGLTIELNYSKFQYLKDLKNGIDV